MEHQEYYIIRGDRSGVFFGQIVERMTRFAMQQAVNRK